MVKFLLFQAIQSVLAHRKYILKIPPTQPDKFYYLSNGSRRFDPSQFDGVLTQNQHITSYVVTGKFAKAYTGDIEKRIHTTKTGVTKEYNATKRGERGTVDMYSDIINTEKISFATIEKARLRQRLKKLKTIAPSKKRPCRILSSTSDSSSASGDDDATDDDTEDSSEDEEPESQSDVTPERSSTPIGSPEQLREDNASSPPRPDTPPAYIEKKMRVKKRQFPPPEEQSPPCKMQPTAKDY